MAESSSDEDTTVRVVIVGDNGCGKTSFLHTYLYNEFPEGKYDSKSSRLVKERKQVDHGGRSYRVAFDDTRNNTQEDRDRLLAYPFGDIIIICYDVSKKDTLTLNVPEKWLVEISHHCHSGPPCFLVGLKADLTPEISSSDVQTIQSAHSQIVKVASISARSDVSKAAEVFTAAIGLGISFKEQQKKDTATSTPSPKPSGKTPANKAKAKGGGNGGKGGGGGGCNLF